MTQILAPVLSFGSQLHMMKRSAGVASLFILLFFLSFNGFLVYLIIERISETRTKFANASTTALLATINDYNKLKAIDSASRPGHGWIVYAPKKIEMNRVDSQTVKLTAPFSFLVTDTVEPAFIDAIVNIPLFKSIDLKTFDSIFQKALHKNVQAEYRL